MEKPIDYKIIGGYIYAENTEQKRICKDCDSENKIFTLNKKFVYSYKYLDIHRKAFHFKISDNGNWNFIDLSSNDPAAIRNIELKIFPGGEHLKNTFYCQTNIGYKLHEKLLDYSFSGLIENKMNVWMHPPRDYLFHILELNPFPYIKAPYVIGNEWEWKLDIGSQWGDKRWKEWSGNIHNVYHYKISETTTIDSNLGKLTCFVIEGSAKSELGVTKLKSYFNETYGFVKLEYTNIDNSTIELILERIDNPSPIKYLNNL